MGKPKTRYVVSASHGWRKTAKTLAEARKMARSGDFRRAENIYIEKITVVEFRKKA